MLRTSLKNSKEKEHSKLQTRQQKERAKETGDIRGWFGIVPKLPRGRPKKSTHDDIKGFAVVSTKGVSTSTRTTTSTSTSTKEGITTKRTANESMIAPPNPKRMRGGGLYNLWYSASDEQFKVLMAAVANMMKPNAMRGLLESCQVARSTVHRYIPLFELAAKANGVPVTEVTQDMIFLSSKKTQRHSLLSESDKKFVADVAISRDLRNNGMTRAEMIAMIMELSQSSMQQAKNHFDYLVRSGHLEGLKRGGRVVTCQKTTSKRSQITMEQQLRWHTSVDLALLEQVRLNLPAEEFEKVKEHFFCNMDESCLLGSDGTVKTIGSSSKSKTEKIMSDCCASITVLRTGAAGGSTGPWIFLAAGKELTCRALQNIDKRDGVPKNSKIYMTPTAYMTDSTYAIIAPELADGIRKMPFICEHPNWWVVVSLDGFGSHVNVHQAQEAFYKRKILILKEEGDTSHLNQAYDQSVAKNDKAGMRANLDLLCVHIGTRLDQ